MRCFAHILARAVAIPICGCKATQPAAAETRLMWGAKHSVFIGNKTLRSPQATTRRNIASGKEIFSHYCAACHGLDGQNTVVPFADLMAPPVPSLASHEIQQYTDGQLEWVIEYGIWPSGMPGSKDILSEEDIWSIVMFIRHLPRAGSLGEPQMYGY